MSAGRYAQGERAIERGAVGVTLHQSQNGRTYTLPIIDPNEWALAEYAPWTATGRSELVSIHRTKREAEAERARRNNERGRRKDGRFILLRRDENGRWSKA